jgi:DNA transposition AAA+ family ATPase
MTLQALVVALKEQIKDYCNIIPFLLKKNLKIMFELVRESVLNRLKTVAQAKLATQIGVAPATLDNIKNSRIDKVSDEMLRKMAAFFDLQFNDNEFEWRFYKTPQVQIVHKTIADAYAMKRMVGIVGNTGLGKSTAMRDFATGNAHCGYVLCDTLMSPIDLVTAIAKALGLQVDGKIRDILIRIAKNLIEKEGILILDDASKLQDNCIRLIQIMYDTTERRCAIVLSGLQRLQTSIRRKAEKDRLGFREFQRRVAYWRELPLMTKGEVKFIATDYQLDIEVIRLLASKCDNYGCLRNAIQNLWTWRQRNPNEVLTREIASELIE